MIEGVIIDILSSCAGHHVLAYHPLANSSFHETFTTVYWIEPPVGFLFENMIGYARFVRCDEGHCAQFVQVDMDWRGKGVATLMYDAIEAKVGRVVPSKTQTDSAKGFWKARLAPVLSSHSESVSS